MPTPPRKLDRPRCQALDEVLRKAICLAHELEGLLESKAAEGTFRFRLARAHTLTAIDVLTDLALQEAGAEPVFISDFPPMVPVAADS